MKYSATDCPRCGSASLNAPDYTNCAACGWKSPGCEVAAEIDTTKPLRKKSKIVHIALCFPGVKGFATICGCDQRAAVRRFFLVDSRVRLSDVEAKELSSQGFRHCAKCKALMRKIQPVGRMISRMLRQLATAALYETAVSPERRINLDE